MWANGLGEYLGLKDAAGTTYTHNAFNRPTSEDVHLLMKAIDSPMGAKFLLCANALGMWCLELEARGKGKAGHIRRLKSLLSLWLPWMASCSTRRPTIHVTLPKRAAACRHRTSGINLKAAFFGPIDGNTSFPVPSTRTSSKCSPA
jgi:hypothetical protein